MSKEKTFTGVIENSYRNLNQSFVSNYDYLTGLPSMHYFFALADAGVKEMVERDIEPVMLYFDLSGMRIFNQRYGFAEGDKLLRAFAELLVKYFDSEKCSRFDSDHFVAYCNRIYYESILAKIIDEVNDINNGRSVPVRVGVYDLVVGNEDISVSCDRAKLACNQGKNRYVSEIIYFEPVMLKNEQQRKYILSHIDQALTEEWIKVYNQPIIRAANGKVCEEEALARWEDPRYGTIYPKDFIPILEDVRQAYRLDLFIVSKVLNKMKIQKEAGLYVVPESVNISQSDFYSCDIVEEIRKLVDASGIDREKLIIEITESIVVSDLNYINNQIKRFQEYGFHVWLDDFGSGYSSQGFLQAVHFDAIKFDIQFMRQFYDGGSSKIILSELIRLVISLGMDTVVEGVEYEDQVEFLKEVGCTKLQGFFYCKPIPLTGILDRNKKGIDIGFENPLESGYYSAIGKVNLYDASITVDDDDDDDDAGLNSHFNTTPMAVFESDGNAVWLVRMNEAFRKNHDRIFLDIAEESKVKVDEVLDPQMRAFGATMLGCCADKRQTFMDMTLRDGATAHLYMKRVAVNEAKKVFAFVLIVLGITTIDKDTDNPSLTYLDVTKALASDYIFYYSVDLDTGKFIEYIPEDNYDSFNVERRGEDFFNEIRSTAKNKIYKDDLEQFLNIFHKEKIVESIENTGVFTTTFRLMIDGVPQYVHMKIVPMSQRGNHIIICVNNIDNQKKRQQAYERVKTEKITYSRIAALVDDYIVIYSVDPVTDDYSIYVANEKAKDFESIKYSKNFFDTVRIFGRNWICKEEREIFSHSFTKENILKKINENGSFSLNTRAIFDGEAIYINLKVAMVEEKDGNRLVVGMSNINEQILQYQEYVQNLTRAHQEAIIDELTGIKNKHAYVQMEEKLNNKLNESYDIHFAIVVFDINGLKEINDKYGHQVGDAYIKSGCEIICNLFAHSPVFRIGGDEFVAIVQGDDYNRLDELMEKLSEINKENENTDKPVIAGGAARYDGDKNCSSVFKRADLKMYRNKNQLKCNEK